MPPKDWLNHYLTHQNRRSLRDSGQPLYRYTMTDDEYQTLQVTLKNSALPGVVNITKISGWNAAFVIYAAEWWQREYDGSSWKWDKIFASFGASNHELTTLKRNQLVKSGLHYWQRKPRIINGRTLYLGTIALEGGLPIRQLTNDGTNGGWLGTVLKQAIPKYIRLQASGVDASEIISEYDCIPKTYQNPEIYSMLSEMVQTVVALKKQYQLHTQANPVEYLNRNNPAWREQFPLPINDETGLKLLSEMVKTAAKADDSSGISFRAIRLLNNNFQLKTQFEFAKFIELEAIFPPAVIENIPSRLEVELFSSASEVIKLGYAQKTTYKGKSCLKMPCVSYSLNNEKQAIKGYSIRFKHLSNIVEQINSIICEEIDNDLPWTFVSKNDEWQLEGVASIRTRATQVRILYAENMAYSANNEVTEITSVVNKKLIEASGIIELKNDENKFVIKTSQSQATEHYYLQGKELNFESNPKELYLGLPKLESLNDETGIKKHAPLARPVNSKADWTPLTTEKQGVYEIRLQDKEGNIQFRKRCVLLPDNFCIRLKPESNSLNGIIYLENIGNAKVSCNSEIKHTIETTENNGCKIECYIENSPPASLPVFLSWVGMTEIVTLNIPFPVRGGQLIDPEGNIYSPRQPLFQDKLHGFRLRLFNENRDIIRNLQLEFNLKNTDSNEKDLYFRDSIKRKDAVIELAIIDYLEWIKALFSLSKNLDSIVELSIYENATRLLCVKVFLYQLLLERNTLEGCVFLQYTDHAKLSYDEISTIQLMAMRLSQPEQEHIALDSKFSEQTEIGSWFFYPEKRLAEPWLIYPSADSSIFLRPILWDGLNEKETRKQLLLEVSTLHSAVTLTDIKIRHLVIKKILLQMCFNFEHSGWDYLRNLWQKCPHLPLSSFDVWSLAVNHPKVLVALILQMDEKFVYNLNEELPVFWELIPLSHWLVVFNGYQNYLKNNPIYDESDIEVLLKSRIDRLSNISISMEIVARILKHTLCNISDQELSFMSLPIALNTVMDTINEAQHELDRRQADSQWLSFFQSELVEYWQDLEASQQLLKMTNEIQPRHLSVILLPVLLAVFCVNGQQNLVADVTHIFKLKQLKAFDEEWFNTTFQFSLAYLSQITEYKSKLIEDANNMININDDEIEQLDKELEQLTDELKSQTGDLKTNTNGLEHDLEQFKDINDELELLRMDNEELKQRLTTAEEKHEHFVNALRETIKKRDDTLKFLLQEVKTLNTKINEIRATRLPTTLQHFDTVR